MEITAQLGDMVLNKLNGLLPCSVNIMNIEGRIVSSSDPSRIGNIHSGALHVLRNNKPLYLYPDDTDAFAGTKEGVNLPLTKNGRNIGVIGMTGHPEKLVNVMQITKAAVELLIAQHHSAIETMWHERGLSLWVQDVMYGRSETDVSLDSYALTHFQINTSSKCSIILIEFDQAGESYRHVRERRSRLAALLIKHIPVHFSAFLHERLLVLGVRNENKFESGDRTIENLILHHADSHGESITIGVGFPRCGASGYKVSFEQAKKSLELRRKLDLSGCIFHIQDFGIHRLTTEISDRWIEDYWDIYGSRIKELDIVSIETCTTFFEKNFNVKETAESLFIHRNTLLYRLEKIKDRIGLNPNLFQDAVILSLLLSVHKLKIK
ncbi:CdaR family transcriptional regulator [Fictibacillus iocasae]|uniref:CdaR family transcriptional regulator n=1 Tax=Fictibacillus iocasae TaxID=2715437 RepID=A0ABW2NNN0_9BACL